MAKLAMYKQKFLNHISRMEDIRYAPKNCLSNCRKKKKTWTTIKEVTQQRRSWGRNWSFIGL